MASPFRIFRKYQKVFIVVAGVILMFVFTIGDVLVQFVGSSAGGPSGGRTADDIAVEWKDGRLTEGELAELTSRRAVTSAFQRQVAAAGEFAVTQEGQTAGPLDVQPVGLLASGRGLEEDLVYTRILANAARRAGMVVSDDAILYYLAALGRNQVNANQMKSLLSGMQVGRRRVSIGYIFEALREELLARDYMAGYVPAFRTLTPEQQWSSWRKVHEFVTIEAAAVSAESLVAEVPEPSADQLAEFFEQYRERVPNPDVVLATALPSPTPAFSVPRRVALHYLLADYDATLQRIAGEVSEQQIEQFYDANKDALFTAAPTSEDSASTPEENESTDNDGLTADEGSAAVTDATAEPPSTAADDDDSAEATSEGSGGQSDDDQGPSDDPATGEPPAGNQSQPTVGSPFQFARFQSDSGEAVGSEAVDGTNDGATPVDGVETEPVAEVAGGNPPTETAASEADSPVAEPESSSAEPPVAYVPLDEVRDQIRRQIAEGKVVAQTGDLLQKIKSNLTEVSTKFSLARVDLEEAGKDPPAPPAELTDLTPLAQENQLAYERLKPVSQYELSATNVGRAYVPAEYSQTIFQLVFQEGELYVPYHATDLDGNQYLVLKTADEPRRVPELDEVRDEVVASWKLMKAADLALSKAEQLAQQARDAGVTLEEFFRDQEGFEVVTTDSFSWLTRGSISRTGFVQNFRLSQPPPIVAPGPRFMETVFGLNADDVRAVLNHDRTRAYVIRLVERAESVEQLRGNFMQMQSTGIWDGLMATVRSQQQDLQLALVRSLVSAQTIEWQRPPDQPFANADAQ